MTAPDRSTGWRAVRSFDATPIAWRLDAPPDPLADTVPLVLCNGIACSDSYWRDCVESLARTRQVLRWDYRGHGRSDPPADPSRVGVAAVVGDLVATLEAAGLGTVALMGHSYGVQVVLEAVRALPDRVGGVVAVAGAPGAPLRRVAATLGLPVADALAQ
ncbi:MAG: alpha/beta fold hydrolase, partial [Egibacteraceae bacterium]